MKSILIPTDLSEESERVLEPVGELARCIGARVVLLHIVVTAAMPVGALPVAVAPVPEDPQGVRDRAVRRLRETRSRLSGLDVAIEVAFGTDVGTTILEYAAENDIDCIAMATHGRSGLSRIVLGSVAETVLRGSHVPVFLYPDAD